MRSFDAPNVALQCRAFGRWSNQRSIAMVRPQSGAQGGFSHWNTSETGPPAAPVCSKRSRRPHRAGYLLSKYVMAACQFSGMARWQVALNQGRSSARRSCRETGWSESNSFCGIFKSVPLCRRPKRSDPRSDSYSRGQWGMAGSMAAIRRCGTDAVNGDKGKPQHSG